MTGAHEAEGRPLHSAPDGGAKPPRHHARRSLAWRIGTPTVVLLSGALFAVSAADSGGTDLRPGRYTDLASLAEAEADDVKQLQARARDLEQDIDRMSENVRSFRVRTTRHEVERLHDPAGLTPRTGPGLSITLSDAPDDLFEDARDAGASGDVLRRYVVHQQDIQAVVNSLWRAGAEAVVIEGQRVVSTTGIKCEGNAVQLQGVPYPEPYDIEAVGDPTALLSALDSDPIVAGYRADAADPEIAIGWDVETEQQVEAPAFEGLVDIRYAEPLR
ncbi:uncharacterized protein YlxW (UPF0749 family) [Nocardioides thalensis]|uniref:Uncharacterized protein YlxW (UPF0749 family) n=1 Tax=Nocardioides thalensis TaxID=1914755 RepID=A0A853C6X2_9ACTN|nr:DUF881 domain-containing protein [Nocardioides thalensis]NYJ03615.1 uncharacterized protein YlxW (UPF0749 family) [Nocardioides thalensis]